MYTNPKFQFLDSLGGCAGVWACHSKLRLPKIAEMSSEYQPVAANQLRSRSSRF